MATYTVITYRCPRCRADVGRRFGLHTRLMIACHHCGNNVRIDRNVVGQNWGFNFAWAGTLVIWLLLGIGVLADPELAAMIGRETFPADTLEHRVVIAGVCILPALLAGLVVGGVGWLLGMIVALEESAASAEAGARPAWPPSTQGPRPGGGFSPPTAPPSPPQPRRRSIFVRAIFVLLWTVVFFIGTGVVLGMVARAGVQPLDRRPADKVSTVGLIASPLGQGPLLAAASLLPEEGRDEQRRQDAAAQMGEQSAPWLLLGTLVVFVLGCVGLLPKTGRGKAPRTAARPELSGPAPQGPSRAGGYAFGNQPPAPAPEPPRRNVFVRGLFVLLWPTVFFFGAGLTAAALAGAFSTANEELQKHIFRQSAEADAAWLLLGSLLLLVLGCVGLLPWTGAKKRKPA